jgi:hypothetical protein
MVQRFRAAKPDWFIAGTRRQVLAASLAGIATGISLPRLGKNAAAAADLTEVLVRGVAGLPLGDVAWRLVQDVAEAPGAGQFERRALGFIICRSSPIQVTEQATGSAFRLEAHSAAFVAAGVAQLRESLVASAVDYLRLALVPAPEALESGGDRLLFAGRAFASPALPSAMTLSRLTLQLGAVVAREGAVGDTFVLVEQGSVDVIAGPERRTLTTVVGSDTAYGIGLFTEPLTISGARDATIVLVAEIGAAR